MALRHRERQIDNLLAKLGQDPSGRLRVKQQRGIDLDLDELHGVELKRFHEFLTRYLSSRGMKLRSIGSHSPYDPMPGCECGICEMPTEPLSEREAKELSFYLGVITPDS